MKHHQLSPTIWTIDAFCSAAECRALVQLSEREGFASADVGLPGGARMVQGIRNNERAIHTDAELTATFWRRLSPYCPPTLDGWAAVGLHERLRFYKYRPGQRFRRHIDGASQRGPGEKSFITFMIYLNDDFRGGQTRFDAVAVQPRVGMALCFMHAQKHEGCVVESGVKYVARSDVMYRRIP